MKYEGTLIVNFSEDTQIEAQGLANEVQINTGQEVKHLNYHDPDYNTQADIISQNLNHNWRVYLIIHGNLGEQKWISRPDGRTWDDQQFAQEIIKLTKHLCIDPKDFDPEARKLTVSMLTCFGALPQGASILNSMASRILWLLGESGRFFDGYARQSAVLIGSEFGKLTSRMKDNEKFILPNYRYLHIKDKPVSSAIKETLKQEASCEDAKKIKTELIKKQENSKIAFVWQMSPSKELFQVAYDAYQLKKFRSDCKLIITQDENINLHKCIHEYVLVVDTNNDMRSFCYIDVTGKQHTISITDYELFKKNLDMLAESVNCEEEKVRSKREIVMPLSAENLQTMITENTDSHHTPSIHPFETRNIAEWELIKTLEMKNQDNQQQKGRFFSFTTTDAPKHWDKEQPIEQLIAELKQEIQILEKKVTPNKVLKSFISERTLSNYKQDKAYLTQLCTALELREAPSSPPINSKYSEWHKTATQLMANRDPYFITLTS